MAEGLIAMASAGQAVCITPFTLAGAMAPVTLAGTLTQQNAEALVGITLTQVVRPGAPSFTARSRPMSTCVRLTVLRHAGIRQGGAGQRATGRGVTAFRCVPAA